MLLIKNADLYTMEGEGRLKGGDVLVDARRDSGRGP